MGDLYSLHAKPEFIPLGLPVSWKNDSPKLRQATLDAVRTLGKWDGVANLGVIQDPSSITKAPRLKKSDAEINWQLSARMIDCHVRGMQPWPIAFTHFQPVETKPPMRLAIKKIRVLDKPAASYSAGEIVPGDQFVVAAGDFLIELLEIQPAGKRQMSGIDFLGAITAGRVTITLTKLLGLVCLLKSLDFVPASSNVCLPDGRITS